MHSAGFVALFLSLFGGSSADVCPASDAFIEVVARLPGSAVDHGRTRRQIGAAMMHAPMAGFVMQGLTVMDFGTSFTMEVSLSRLGSGRWCVGLERVSAEFGFKRPADVLVASEIEKGSCEYDAVLAHEMDHVAVGERNVLLGADEMEASLLELAKGAFPVEADSREEAYSMARRAVESTVNAVAEMAIDRADRENAAMDTKEAYERLGNLCR